MYKGKLSDWCCQVPSLPLASAMRANVLSTELGVLMIASLDHEDHYSIVRSSFSVMCKNYVYFLLWWKLKLIRMSNDAWNACLYKQY